MQLFPILLVAIVLAAEAGIDLQPAWFELTAAQTIAAVWTPAAIVVFGTWMVIATCRLRMNHTGSPLMLIIAERCTAMARWLLLIHHAIALFVLNWLDVIREGIGDLILVDELIALSPPLIGVIALWWAYYPIEVRIREAMLIRRLDLGRPIHPLPTRCRYVLEQTRSGLLLLLVPLLLILAIAESIGFAAERFVEPEIAWQIANVSILLAAAMIFLIAPLIARVLLNVQSVPDGEVRGELLEVCRRHRVRVRDVLLWNTGGSMINAAVMGLVGRLRYVLITDGLLETMRPEQVRAVMAHEVGHIRRHHMPWMVLALLAMLALTILAMEGVVFTLIAAGVPAGHDPQWVLGLMILVQLGVVLVAFGWVSRRFERQADTFAVQHLSGLGDSSNHEGNPEQTITPDAVAAMNSALNTIAQRNAVNPHRPSWRHGSIAWRQSYLAHLIGRPIEGMQIDRVIRRIKLATAAALLLTVVSWMALGSLPAPPPEQERRALPAGEVLHVKSSEMRIIP